jgi:predicted ABC-class ATPase
VKAKGMPEHRLIPRCDPMLDQSRREVIWAAIGRWSAGIILVLVLAAVGGYLDSYDAAIALKESADESREKSRQIARLQGELATRAAAGSCSTLFYLIEADSLEMAGDKLYKASMQLATVANSAMYPEPTPPYQPLQ